VLAANFNHAILAIDLPDGRVYVDPTSRTAPFGDLPSVDEDRRALLADQGSGLVPMPESSIDADARVDTYELSLGADGQATGTFRSTLQGAWADTIRQRLLIEPKKRHRDVVADEIAIWTPQVDADGLVIEGAPPPDHPTPVVIRGKLTLDLVPGLAAGQSTVLRTRSFLASAARRFDDEKRDVAVLIGGRSRDESVVRLRLPAGLRVKAVPPDAKVECPWSFYERAMSIEEEGAVLVVSRRVHRSERVLPASAWGEYRAWLDRALVADEEPVVLEAEVTR
jgi:hypothetical protein